MDNLGSRKQGLLLTYGAILFKGLPLDTPEQSLPYPYIRGAAPRSVVTGDVFTSNESPLDQVTPFHHMISQVPNPPAVLFFYCDIPPKTKGQTPILYSPAVYKEMKARDPDLRSAWRRTGYGM